MSDPTPETLRDYAKKYSDSTLPMDASRAIVPKAKLRAAADAWDTQLADHASAYWDLKDDYDDLRKRLEEAEKALAGIRLVSSGPYHLFIFNWWAKLRWVHDFADAALAAQKEAP